MMRSTQKSKNSLETRKIRKILNEEAKLGISPNSDSDTEEVDLQKELYPLGHYINNREEMIEQMFSIIKGAKLRKMLPPILKDMPVDELKADCLIHLLGMSKKRIRAILEGREINSSSDSESRSDSSSTPRKKPKVELKPFVVKQEGCSDISDNSEEVVLVDPDLDFLNLATNTNDNAKLEKSGGKKKPKRKLKRKDLEKKHKRSKTKVVEEASESDEVQEIESSAESDCENENENESPKEGKTLLEILELEMRARAIRALLKNNDPQESEEFQKPVETKKPTHSKEKSSKVTPAKNFRKKKHKNDDVIVITPKVVTIDLTDESEQNIKNSREGNREDGIRSSTQNENEAGNDKAETSKEGNHGSEPDQTTVSEEQSKSKDKVTSEMVTLCYINKSPQSNDQKQTSNPESEKSSWAQRWLESKEVKKVVSTSKICGNIRKKIKSAKLAKKQTPSQDDQPTQAISKEIEGSVVEYKQLSKTKTTTTSNEDVIENDNQKSTISEKQELTSSEANFADVSTADQVQDVSSTRIENVSTNMVHDITSGIQISEEAVDVNIEYNVTGTGVLKLDEKNKVISCKKSVEEGDGRNDGPSTFHIVGKIGSNLENTNGESESCEKDDVCNKNKSDNNFLNDKGTNPDEIKEKQESLISSPDLNSSCPTENLAILNEKSNNVDEFGNISLHKDVIGPKESEPESNASPTAAISNIISKECDSNQTDDTEINSNNQNNQESVCKNEEEADFFNTTEKNVIPHCVTKPVQELNEPEALEINITEEDRDIEDAIDEISETKSTCCKDSIIVIL